MQGWAAPMLLAAAALAPAEFAAAGEAEIVAELQQQIARCWAPPADGGTSATPVTLAFQLGRDGALTSVPTIVANPDILEYSKQFVASASRAVRACAPYRPPENEYGTWKDVTITFSPPEP